MTQPRKKDGAVGRALTGLLVAGLLGGALVLGVMEAKGRALLPEGTPAPDFTLQRYAGGQVSLEQLKGKVVLLDFWATWCPPCVAEMPYLVKVAREYEQKGLVFVAANVDEEEQAAVVDAFVNQRVPDLAPYAAFADWPVQSQYRVRVLPTLYLIDREGKIVQAYSSQVSETKLRRWVEQALE